MRLALIRLARREVTIIGSANGLSGRIPGCEAGPEIIRSSTLMKQCRVPWRWAQTVQEVDADKYDGIPAVATLSNALAGATKRAVGDRRDLVVIGGDHSCAIGTWSGVAHAVAHSGPLGLLWIDAHLDAHTPRTTPTGNIHGMPLAHLLGHGDSRLANIFGYAPKVRPEHVAILGARCYEEEERELLEKLKVRIFFMDEIIRHGLHATLNEGLAIVQNGTRRFGMSIDLDGFRHQDAPAVGTPALGGIVAEDFLHAIQDANLSKLVATEIAEFLPALDNEERDSERLIVKLIEAIYLTKWSQK
ncbi:Protein T21F4.1 b [Aphelenchoides avenae]|nr:Protein T21F4.1 b [Aphelenchus avenae]